MSADDDSTDDLNAIAARELWAFRAAEMGDRLMDDAPPTALCIACRRVRQVDERQLCMRCDSRRRRA